MIEDEDARPDDKIFSKDDDTFKKEVISDALKELDSREVKIIKERHLTDKAKTLDILGQELKISKERVRQIEKNAMIKMKSFISKSDGADLLFKQ
mgnify:FL=1